MEKVDISSLPLPQLTEWVTGTLGEPKFRAGQIYRWIHQKRVGSFAEMTNLSTALRQKLEERAFLTVLTTRRRLESKLDETVKLLLELPDQNWRGSRSDAVRAWAESLHFHPGGLPHGVQILRLHAGRAGTQPDPGRDAGRSL